MPGADRSGGFVCRDLSSADVIAVYLPTNCSAIAPQFENQADPASFRTSSNPGIPPSAALICLARRR
jgi:hypothetical protein